MSNIFLKFAKYQVSQVLTLLSGHTPLYVSIGHLEEAKTVHQLTKAMNKIQSSLWKLKSNERLLASQRATAVLSQHVLKASDASLKLIAADWLRLLLQAGVVAQPETVFVTLVTAAIQAFQGNTQESAHELRMYLKLILESLWPFRSPYAAYPRELFPPESVFYPLIPLLNQADTEKQESLLLIFAALQTLDDVESEKHFLFPARNGSSNADPERRRRSPCIWARMNHLSTQGTGSLTVGSLFSCLYAYDSTLYVLDTVNEVLIGSQNYK